MDSRLGSLSNAYPIRNFLDILKYLVVSQTLPGPDGALYRWHEPDKIRFFQYSEIFR